MTSLNGGRTRPLTAAARHALARLEHRPLPRQEFNPGIVDRLLRGGLVEVVRLPSPYKTVKGNVDHLKITETGRAAAGL